MMQRDFIFYTTPRFMNAKESEYDEAFEGSDIIEFDFEATTDETDRQEDNSGFPNGERYDGSKASPDGADENDDSDLLIWSDQDPAFDVGGANTVDGATADAPGDTNSNPPADDDSVEFDPAWALDTLVASSGEDRLPGSYDLPFDDDVFDLTPDTTGPGLMAEDTSADAVVLLIGLGPVVNQFGAPPPVAGSFDVPLPDDQEIAADDYSPLDFI